MKRVLLLSVFSALLFLSGCKTQEDPAKLLAEKDEMEYLHNNALQAIKNNSFVLEANTIVFRRGHTAHVNSNLNFVSLKDGKAVVQLAFNSPYAGPNGIGGITVEGDARNIKIEEGKNGNITFSMDVNGRGISARVTLQMPKGTNQCWATVSPNFSSNRITFTGGLYPDELSGVFKARPL